MNEEGAAVRSDSAGLPWAGRTLTAQPFAGDDGGADDALVTALAAWCADGSLVPVVAAWAASRVLVPVVAVLGEGAEAVAVPSGGEVHADKSADMALPVLTGRDGRRALPAFTSVTTLATWDASARPVPVEAARAAQSAVAEGCDVVVLDVSGPVTCVLPRPAVWAVAQGREWVSPAEDPEVLAAVAAACAPVPQVARHGCEPDGPAGVRVALGLVPGLDTAGAEVVAGEIGRRLRESDLLTERVDAVRLTLH